METEKSYVGRWPKLSVLRERGNIADWKKKQRLLTEIRRDRNKRLVSVRKAKERALRFSAKCSRAAEKGEKLPTAREAATRAVLTKIRTARGEHESTRVPLCGEKRKRSNQYYAADVYKQCDEILAFRRANHGRKPLQSRGAFPEEHRLAVMQAKLKSRCTKALSSKSSMRQLTPQERDYYEFCMSTEITTCNDSGGSHPVAPCNTGSSDMEQFAAQAVVATGSGSGGPHPVAQLPVADDDDEQRADDDDEPLAPGSRDDEELAAQQAKLKSHCTLALSSKPSMCQLTLDCYMSTEAATAQRHSETQGSPQLDPESVQKPPRTPRRRQRPHEAPRSAQKHCQRRRGLRSAQERPEALSQGLNWTKQLRAPKIFMKVLYPIWANAIADGYKRFECVATKKRWTNQFKQLRSGDFIILIRKGGLEVNAVCEVASAATIKETNREVLKGKLQGAFHDELDLYLRGATSFDYIEFKQVFDCRSIVSSCLLERLGLQIPKIPLVGLLRPVGTDGQWHNRLHECMELAVRRPPVSPAISSCEIQPVASG